MKKIKDYLIELSLIVIGVLIAISVDDYREKSKTDAMLQSYLKVLKNDLTENVKLLDEEIFYDSVALHRLALLRDKALSGNYTGLDSLALHLLEHSSFTVNDTGFRMIIQSGSSHNIEADKLAKLTNLFGAAMTDLSFFQSSDAHIWTRGQSFLTKHHSQIDQLLKQKRPGFATEFINLVFSRIATMTAEWQEKKKFRKKVLEIIDTL